MLRSFFLIVALFSSAFSFADWQKIPPTTFWLDLPPAPGSHLESEELALLHRFEQTRTPQDCMLAEEQKKHGFEDLFRKKLSARELSALKSFMKDVFEFGENTSDHFKEYFRRPRPYTTDLTLNPCTTKPSGSKSYPSGHATLGALGACVLAKLLPQRAAEIESYGKLIGELRVISGVHHPSDVEAGRTLANDACDELMKHADFRSALESAKEKL